MSEIFKKLRFTDQKEVLLLNLPDAVRAYAKELPEGTAIEEKIGKGPYGFIMLFALSHEDVQKNAGSVVDALEEDGILWICYPKKSSKKYRTELSRDNILNPFGAYGFEGVTQVAIDEDWSALRIRHVDKIKSMTRSWALSEKGKERIDEK
ncbi:MAG TPA: hypothetical protein VLN47_04310 [Clostridiaceae bacterium]|nr:hypothetical protein [Clostridiaceae bacterium]